MCGINLIIDKTQNLDDTVIQRMNAAINHRGPEHSDWMIMPLESQSIHIGNTRLRIIDPHQRANQPMKSDDGQYCITFNGEIYNHNELRAELWQLGYLFKTESDTEVLLNWLIEFGKEGIASLNGMFAFAFLDIKSSSVLVARDRHGMKPLYFSQTPSKTIFSSEIKGIMASNLMDKVLNEKQLSHYLQFKYAKSPETFFKGIHAVKPGYSILIDNDGFHEEYFKSSVTEEEPEVSIDKVERLLSKSLSRHFNADTPVGLFLSGGVDSTLLLALAKQQGKSAMPTFSIAHAKSEGSFGTEDAEYARKAAKRYGSEHHEFQVDKSILKGFQGHLSQMDQPIGDSASMLTSFLSKKTGQTVKCVLSGAGADEWFAGYNRHQAYYQYLSNFVLSGNTKVLKGLSKLLPTGVDHPLRKQFQLAKKFLDKVDKDPGRTYLNFLRFQYFSDKPELNGIPDSRFFEWALNHDRQNYLVEDVLMLNDQWTMHNSIEMRMPYLDNELTGYIQSLPQELLIDQGKKWVLKSILNKHNGKEFSQRAKEGFGLPMGKWLQDGLFQEQLNFLNAPQSVIFNYIDQKHIQNLVHAHVKKKHDYSLEIWSVMVLANWLEIHFA